MDFVISREFEIDMNDVLICHLLQISILTVKLIVLKITCTFPFYRHMNIILLESIAIVGKAE